MNWHIGIACAVLNALPVLLLTFVAQLEPALGKALGCTPAQELWFAEAVLIAGTCALPLAPFLRERLGEKRAAQVCTVSVALLSALAASVSAMVPMLIVLFLAGAAAAPLAALSQSLVVTALPPEQSSRGMACWTTGSIAGALLATLGSSVLLQTASWQLVFALTWPLAGLALYLLRRLPTGRSQPVPLDLKGWALQVATCLSLTWALSVVPVAGWNDPRVSSLGLGPLFGLLYWRHARRERRPILSVEPLRSTRCLRALVLALLFAATTSGMLESNFLFSRIAPSAAALALRVLIQSLLSLLGVYLAGRWFKGGAGRLLAAALGVTLLGKLAFNFMDAGTVQVALIGFWLSSLGYWCFITVLATLAVEGGPEQAAAAAAWFGLACQLGATLGLAICDAIFDEVGVSSSLDLAYRTVFWLEWAACACLLPLLRGLRRPVPEV